MIIPRHFILPIYLPQFQTWLVFLGYAFVLGTVIAKLWRVYHIFHDPTAVKKVLCHLIIFMLPSVLLLVNFSLFMTGISSFSCLHSVGCRHVCCFWDLLCHHYNRTFILCKMLKTLFSSR